MPLFGEVTCIRCTLDAKKRLKSGQCSKGKKVLLNSVNCEPYVSIQSTSATHSLKTGVYHESLCSSTKNDIPTEVGYQTHGLKPQKQVIFSHHFLHPTCATLFWPSPWLLLLTSMTEHLHLQHFKSNGEGWNWKYYFQVSSQTLGF